MVYVQQQMGSGFNMRMQQACPKCGGSGKTYKAKCPACKGHKVIQEQKTLAVQIEKGMPSDHKIVLKRQSNQTPGSVPGDVIIQLSQKPHDRFQYAIRNSHINHT